MQRKRGNWRRWARRRSDALRQPQLALLSASAADSRDDRGGRTRRCAGGNGTYFQDWLLYDTDWNWRADAAANGAVRAMGDIGSHWMDTIQHLTGLRITSLCADLQTFHKIRRRPKGRWRRSRARSSRRRITSKRRSPPMISAPCWCGLAIVHAGRSQSARSRRAGRIDSNLRFTGPRRGVAWNQERPDELWIGHRNSANQIMVKDPSLLLPSAASFADLPGGHSEGYDDTHKQMFRRFYARVVDDSAAIEYPTFEDGARGMGLLEKVLESSTARRWVDC